MNYLIQGLSLIGALVASALAMYVSTRLYKFKKELVDEISNTYVRADIFARMESGDRRDLDKLNSDVATLQQRYYDIASEIRSNSARIAELKEHVDKIDKSNK